MIEIQLMLKLGPLRYFVQKQRSIHFAYRAKEKEDGTRNIIEMDAFDSAKDIEPVEDEPSKEAAAMAEAWCLAKYYEDRKLQKIQK